MAGRTSSTVVAGRAAKIYTNETGHPVVVAVNAISGDNTRNPSCDLVIDNTSNRALNFETSVYDLAQSIPTTALISDFDLKSSPAGTTIFGQSATAGKNMLTVNGIERPRYPATKYQSPDPYFFENPSAYGKATPYGCYLMQDTGTAVNRIRFNRDLAADKSFYASWMNTTDNTFSPTNDGGYKDIDYFVRGVITCLYTDTFIGYNQQAYMSGGYFYNYNGSSGNPSSLYDNKSSVSVLYYRGGNYDPASHEANDNVRLDAQTDGGVTAFDMHTQTTANISNVVAFISNTFWRSTNSNVSVYDGTFHNATSGGSGHTMDHLVWYSRYWAASLNFTYDGGYRVSWMKYHPTLKTYYLNLQGSSGTSVGIWSFKHDDLFSTSDQAARDFRDVCTKEVGLTHDLTDFTTQPHRIGASLWVCFKGATQADSLYSTDLKNWKSASEFMGVSDAVLVGRVGDQNYHFKSSTPTKLYSISSGFSLIPASGTLETGTPMGVYERNGIILNSNDSLYMENKDLSASVHATVMFVEV